MAALRAGRWVCAVLRRWEMLHRRGNTIPGPCRDRQSCRFLETGPLFPPLAVLRLFPPLSSKEIALHSPRPVGQGSHRSVSFSSPHRTRSAGLRRGPRWSCQRKRAVHGHLRAKSRRFAAVALRNAPLRLREKKNAFRPNFPHVSWGKFGDADMERCRFGNFWVSALGAGVSWVLVVPFLPRESAHRGIESNLQGLAQQPR